MWVESFSLIVDWGLKASCSKGQHSNQWALVFPPRHVVLKHQIRHEWSNKGWLSIFWTFQVNNLPALKGLLVLRRPLEGLGFRASS